MISLNAITLTFGSFTLLDQISLHIGDKEKIGLVGRNGAGKSTILKMIVGMQSPTSGQVMITTGQKIGYLPQIMEHSKGRTVIEETMTVFDGLKALERRMEEISEELAQRTDYESESYNKLLIELNETSDALSLGESEAPLQSAQKTLLGLGFRKNEFDRPTETFSQGWNMRIELAKILLRKPEVLLLDEPTNHLDIESIQWLEDYIRNYNGALVLISHDRRFLDNCTERTVEVMLGHLYDYKVPYSRYVELRKERIEQQKAAFANQQRMIEKTEEFIEKFRYKPTKSNQVQSRVKQLQKLDRIEIDEEDLATLSVKFPPAPRSGDVAFEAKDAVIGYERRKIILNGANLIVKRGEKVAFVGRNGEGKTTMMRVLMDELEPFEGKAAKGYNVDVGYYAQNQEDVLDKKQTVFETLDRIAVGDIRTKLRDILAAFLFRGDEIDKKVAVLSGGERSRLAMAKLMLRAHNLLALDEPTNHMDIRSKDVLKQALQSYDGTLIIVSHDRDFLNGLVDKVYEFNDGKVKEYLGGVDDFLRAKKLESLHQLETSKPQPVKEVKRPETESSTVDSKQDYKAQKVLSREAKKLKNRADFLEKQIGTIEAEMKGIESELSAPTPETDIMELTRKYLDLKRDLDAKMDEWASLS
ncbi:MAG: ABC-F family ATP-binding cassette domain-containing protein [Bacteroidales bacterium]|nr:ABC-F family ATP-binding cassette domain-containing protein [Candidatus Cacconaster equifaecalis]